MGFDWDKVLPSSSKFSISAGKQKHMKNIVATTTRITGSLSPITGKGEEKIPISPLKFSKGDGSLGNSKHENGGKDLPGLEPVRMGSKNARHLNVNTHRVLIHGKERAISGVKGHALSNHTPNPFPCSSACDSRKRLLHCGSNLSINGSPKTAKTDSSKAPVCIYNRTFVTESSANSRVGVLPKSPHGRDILSYGNVYKASKSSISERDPAHSKNAQVNDNVPQGKGDMCSSVFSPMQRSNYNVFGFGGRNYGHGSIIKGVMNVKKLRSKHELIGIKSITDEQNMSLIPKSASDFASVEEVKNAGNEKYRRGLFMEAISFYNKAIELCPQNAACHYNKAAALAGLGKLTEAVEECLEAINCDPSYCRAHFRLGTLYTRLGRVENAKWHFKLSGHDHHSEAMQCLLDLEDHLRNMEKAQKEENWDNALAECILSIQAGADASDQVVAVKAEALLKLHRAKEALELLMELRNSSECRSRRACKESSSLLILETQAYLYLGRFEEGVHAAEEAVKLDPNSKSLMWLKRATSVGNARKAGNEYFKAGKYLEARAMYDKGLQYLPMNSILLCNRAACRCELGQWEMAINDCNAALRNLPDYSKALLRRARAYAKLGRWEESLRDYLTLSKAIPRDQTIYDSLLEVQMELKKAQYL